MNKEPEFVLEIRKIMKSEGLKPDEIDRLVDLCREFVAETMDALSSRVDKMPEHLQANTFFSALCVLRESIDAIMITGTEEERDRPN
jgi:hypothetical protein